MALRGLAQRMRLGVVAVQTGARRLAVRLLGGWIVSPSSSTTLTLGSMTQVPVTGRAMTAAVGTPTTSSVVTGVPTSIDLGVYRFAAGAGTTWVSNGVPLIPGQLMPADVGKVRLLLGGVEVACYVELLGGRHRDGSVMSILVQYNAGVMAEASSLSGFTLDLSAASAVARVAKNTTTISTDDGWFQNPPINPAYVFVPWTFPQGGLLPTSADHLCRTNLWLGIGRRLTPFAQRPASPAGIAQGENEYDYYAQQLWTRVYNDAANYGTAPYDRATHYLQYWCRTADPKYWAEGHRMGCDYLRWWRQHWSPEGAQGNYPEYTNQRELAVYYLLSGDPEALTYYGKVQGYLCYQVRSGYARSDSGAVLENPKNDIWMGGMNGDDRVQARVLEGVIFGDLIGAPLQASNGFDNYTIRGYAARYIEELLARFFATADLGMWGGDYYSKTTDDGGSTWTYHRGGYVWHNGTWFKCLKPHTSSAADEPGIGVNSGTYWGATTIPSGFNPWGGQPAWQVNRGYYPGYKFYMVCLLLQSIIQYYEFVTADPRIPVVVQTSLDRLWQDFNAVGTPAIGNTSQGWPYCLYANTGTDYPPKDGIPDEGPTMPYSATAELNNYACHLYAWYYKYSGDVTYQTRADTIAQAGLWGRQPNTNNWVDYPEQFEQAHFGWHDFIYLRT